MLCKMLRNSSRRIAVITAAVSLMTLAAAAPSGAYSDGDEVIQPPTTGKYAYGVYGPNDAARFPEIGPIYTNTGDPKFGGNVRRITNEFPNPSKSQIYSKNGFWSADGKLMFHLTTSETPTVINTATGASVAVPGDYKGFDGSFAPDDAPGGPYHWYHFLGSKLMQYEITIATTDGSLSLVSATPTPVKDFKEFGARMLGGLGGSVDWIDNSGQSMVLNLNGKVRVWNKKTGNLYSGSVGAGGADWIGMSPDGKYVVTSTDRGFYSYAITHKADGTGTLSTKGILFWTLCGGHGDLVTATDDKTYMLAFDCYGDGTAPYDKPAIYAVNVAPATSVSGRTESSRTAQRIPNKRLFEVAWGDDGHFSGVSRGVLRNWAFISIESGVETMDINGDWDSFGRPVGDWWNRPYMQEIVMVNVVTCQVLRVAHHRSRSVSDTYYYQPRVSASWGHDPLLNATDGAMAAWASNFGVANAAGYADIYAIDVAPTDVPVETNRCLS